MKRKKRRNSLLIFSLILLNILLVILVLSTFYVIINTGLFEKDSIDDRDLKYWSYNDRGYIVDSESFNLTGSKDVCWLMIHSYTATPKEMKELAYKINNKFGDQVYVPLLNGSGRYPSLIQDKNIDLWYLQVDKLYSRINKECKQVNVVGSSLGAALSLELAENHKINHLFLLNTFLHIHEKWYYILSCEEQLKLFGKSLAYEKKHKIANLNSEIGRKNHIAYWNMPYEPIMNSLDTLQEITNNLYNITSPLIMIHSRNDMTADWRDVNLIYNKSSSNIKFVKWFNKSNHILLMDYNKSEVINYILDSEDNIRQIEAKS